MMRCKRTILIAAGMLATTAGWSQDAAATSFLDRNFDELVLGLLIIVLALFLLGSLSIFRGMLHLLLEDLPEEKRQKFLDSYIGFGFNWKKFNKIVTDAVPIEKEKDIMLDHEYDGIRELDNHLPPWWKWLFYVTIIYAVIYIGYYYVFDMGMNQYEKYDMKVAEAEIAKKEYLAASANSVDETTVTIETDAARIAEGKTIYFRDCVACHGEFGEGKIGPNLTDQYWIHGGSIQDIFKTIKYGVPNKGMISWQDQLLPSQMSDVANFILTLQGTNPPNPKEPQGDLYQPAETVSAETGAETAVPADSVTAAVE